ncbi:LysR substrate-binding domain-containing protein [Pararhizobium qamdonense]|uniref:LysR substrate-binding domain-containing protein n=1 Tax=Pararhizobium qamdonense TaxID=3031126 RepID=UPI0023E0AD7B|nr:LysR substrate-binding domain-containing protein [Pararhizobium qamdonense]
MAINIRQIEIFHALMTAGTATRAAEILRISQPAVSKAIQELERNLGFPLFVRAKGKMSPTAEARLFFRDVEASFSGLITLRNAASRIRDFGSGEIRIASLSALSTNIVPKALTVFRKRHPQVAITFQTHLSSVVRDLVASGQFDIGLAADEIDLAGVDSRPFAKFRAVVALPSGHPLENREAISAIDLDGQDFIALAAEDTARREADAIFKGEGSTPKIILETPYSTTICAMVAAGLGTGLVHPLTTEPYFRSGLVVKPFSHDVFFRSLVLLPPNEAPSRIVADFIESLEGFARFDVA